MVRMFIRHTIKDYALWRASYDSFDSDRAGMGVTAHAVYRAADNPNDVTVWHDFATLEGAQSFAGSAALRDRMAGAGVVGAPQVWFTHPA